MSLHCPTSTAAKSADSRLGGAGPVIFLFLLPPAVLFLWCVCHGPQYLSNLEFTRLPFCVNIWRVWALLLWMYSLLSPTSPSGSPIMHILVHSKVSHLFLRFRLFFFYFSLFLGLHNFYHSKSLLILFLSIQVNSWAPLGNIFSYFKLQDYHLLKIISICSQIIFW